MLKLFYTMASKLPRHHSDSGFRCRIHRYPNYNTLKLRLEAVHSAVEAAAVEARRRVRLNEGR